VQENASIFFCNVQAPTALLRTVVVNWAERPPAAASVGLGVAKAGENVVEFHLPHPRAKSQVGPERKSCEMKPP